MYDMAAAAPKAAVVALRKRPDDLDVSWPSAGVVTLELCNRADDTDLDLPWPPVSGRLRRRDFFVFERRRRERGGIYIVFVYFTIFFIKLLMFF